MGMGRRAIGFAAVALLLSAGCGGSGDDKSKASSASSSDDTRAKLERCVDAWNAGFADPQITSQEAIGMEAVAAGTVGVYITFDRQSRCLVAVPGETVSQTTPTGPYAYTMTLVGSHSQTDWQASISEYTGEDQALLIQLNEAANKEPNAAMKADGSLELISADQSVLVGSPPTAGSASDSEGGSTEETVPSDTQATPGSACPDSFGAGIAANITTTNAECEWVPSLIQDYTSSGSSTGATATIDGFECTPSSEGGATHIRCVRGAAIIEFDFGD